MLSNYIGLLQAWSYISKWFFQNFRIPQCTHKLWVESFVKNTYIYSDYWKVKLMVNLCFTQEIDDVMTSGHFFNMKWWLIDLLSNSMPNSSDNNNWGMSPEPPIITPYKEHAPYVLNVFKQSTSCTQLTFHCNTTETHNVCYYNYKKAIWNLA